MKVGTKVEVGLKGVKKVELKRGFDRVEVVVEWKRMEMGKRVSGELCRLTAMAS